MIVCYFDGACGPVNPGGTASWGAVAYRLAPKRRGVAPPPRTAILLWQGHGVYDPPVPGETSNNVAEYLGFLAVLNWLSGNWEQWTEPAVVRGDSKLVIEQMSGRWMIKSGLYRPHAVEARSMLATFSRPPTLQWVPREENVEADRLSKLALDEICVRSN